MKLRIASYGLAFILPATAHAVDWQRHDLLGEAGRPLEVSTADGSGETLAAGETPAFFQRITADGTDCEAKDGKTGRIRVVCTAPQSRSVSVYIGKIVGAGQFLIQQIAIDTRMLPAPERVAHVRDRVR